MPQSKPELNWNTVDVAQPHFLISYGEDWEPLAILQASESAEINLLINDIDDDVLSLIKNVVGYYLYEKQEVDPIGYLMYHCTTVANATAKIRFSYVYEITSELMVHFFLCENALCNLENIDLINRAKNHYSDILPINLFDVEQLEMYDKTLRKLTSIIMEEIPASYNFTLTDKPAFEDFRIWLKALTVDEFISILTFLSACDYIELDEEDYVLKYLMQVFFTNQQLS